MVRKEPIRDMKYARKGTNLAAAKQPHARRVRTTNLLRPAGTPAYERFGVSGAALPKSLQNQFRSIVHYKIYDKRMHTDSQPGVPNLVLKTLPGV